MNPWCQGSAENVNSLTAKPEKSRVFDLCPLCQTRDLGFLSVVPYSATGGSCPLIYGSTGLTLELNGLPQTIKQMSVFVGVCVFECVCGVEGKCVCGVEGKSPH